MNRDVLMNISDSLNFHITQNHLSYRGEKPVGKGAAGDKTYPIDMKAEEIILASLVATGEPLTFISEESGRIDLKGGGMTILVDPIDGSRNAITGVPFFGTSIACAEGNTLDSVTLGLVVNLISGDRFLAERGKGAFLNGVPIRTQAETSIFIVAYEAQVPRKDLPVVVKLLPDARRARCLGSTALDLAHLAAGAFSVFINPSPSRSFDFAAGYLLVREAGGIFTDTEGNPIDHVHLGLSRSVPLLASCNSSVHDKALRLLASVG